MKSTLVPIDKAGRVVLPKDVREELAIRPGDLLKITVNGDEVVLRPIKEAYGFIRRGQALVFSSARPDLLDQETVEGIRNATRDEAVNHLSTGLPTQKPG